MGKANDISCLWGMGPGSLWLVKGIGPGHLCGMGPGSLWLVKGIGAGHLWGMGPGSLWLVKGTEAGHLLLAECKQLNDYTDLQGEYSIMFNPLMDKPEKSPQTQKALMWKLKSKKTISTTSTVSLVHTVLETLLPWWGLPSITTGQPNWYLLFDQGVGVGSGPLDFYFYKY